MKLTELKLIVDRACERHPDDDVVVVTAMPAIGGRRTVQVKGFGIGFDWERGKAIFSTEEPLYTRTQEDEIHKLRKQVDGLVWENMNLKRENKKATKP